ncbi:MAG: SpoIIE family protein phosphatase [Pirellulaceae bacterium]
MPTKESGHLRLFAGHDDHPSDDSSEIKSRPYLRRDDSVTDDPNDLVCRIQAILDNGVDILHASAAALYLIDDDTRHLLLQVPSSLGAVSNWEYKRQLKSAHADLKALTGHVVTIQTTERMKHWNAPTEFPSAVCIPVVDGMVPLGTLWFFFEEEDAGNEQATKMAELIGSHIESELNRAEPEPIAGQASALKYGMLWQQNRLPNPSIDCDHWLLRGHVSQNSALTSGFFDWDFTDDRISATLGAAQGSVIEAAFTAASVQTASRCYAKRTLKPSEILELTNQSIWTGGVGDQFASMVNIQIANDGSGLLVSAAGDCRVLLIKDQENISVAQYGPDLGTVDAGDYEDVELSLDSGDTLAVFSDSAWDAVSHLFDPTNRTESCAEDLQHLYSDLKNTLTYTESLTDAVFILLQRV